MRTDRKGIPKKMMEARNQEEKSTKYCHSEDNKLLFLLYIDKKKANKKNVIVISTMHKNVGEYDHTKGGVAIVNLISSKFSVHIK